MTSSDAKLSMEWCRPNSITTSIDLPSLLTYIGKRLLRKIQKVISMQTHEMREEQFTVAAYESDFTGRLALASLFDRFQEIAGHHATHLDVGFEKLREVGAAWMLSRIRVKIETLPKWGETVTLRTWPKGVDRLFALRDFRLTNGDGKVLVLATTCWLLVDIEKGRPRRLESLGVDLRFPNAEQAIGEIPDKISAPGNLKSVYEKQILASELDVNEHVNNAHYVRWAMDCFDAAKLRSSEARTVQVNYLEQVLYGDRVAISMSWDSEMPNAHYVDGVNRNSSSKVFQALIEWA